MSDTYLGQILMAGFAFAPRGFATCDGQLLSTSQNASLFALLGATYGGNGSSTFALPDLRGRTPAGGFASQNTATQPADYQQYGLGQRAGTEQVALLATQNPPHVHPLAATTATGVNQYLDGAALLAPVSDPARLYGPATNLVALNGGRSAVVGGQAHDNMQPFQVINFVISLAGIYPPRP